MGWRSSRWTGSERNGGETDWGAVAGGHSVKGFKHSAGIVNSREVLIFGTVQITDTPSGDAKHGESAVFVGAAVQNGSGGIAVFNGGVGDGLGKESADAVGWVGAGTREGNGNCAIGFRYCKLEFVSLIAF